MKKTFVMLLMIGLVGLQAMACDITFKVLDNNKRESFKVGEEVLIEVQLKLTHHHCNYEVNKTKFTYENLKIIGATNWKEEQSGSYTRQVKAQITNDKLGDSKLSVARKCDKEGGFAVFTLKKP